MEFSDVILLIDNSIALLVAIYVINLGYQQVKVLMQQLVEQNKNLSDALVRQCSDNVK